jgi:hypothetical protein
MSVNRSVQAAQRRRAGPTNNEPLVPGRTPQPSINSAQMFANQARTGPGPQIPSGRLAGQHEAMQQQQMQKQMGQKQNNDKLSSVSKMTIPQAITLITLRLGSLESKLLQMPEGATINMDRDLDVDTSLLQSVMSRLESLEKRSVPTTGSVSTPELNLIKQQLDTIKQVVIQTKSSTANLVKENILLKTQMDNFKKELFESKELLESLQKITLENSENILNLSTKSTDGYNNDFNEQNDELQNDELQNDELQSYEFRNDELQSYELQSYELQSYELQNDEFIGTDLKKIIESEINLEM